MIRLPASLLPDQADTTSKFNLFVVKDFFDERTCRALIAEMRCAPVAAATTYGKGEAVIEERVRRVGRVSPSANSVLYVTRRLERHTRNIEEHFGVELGGCEEPQFLRYRIGDFFVAHQDGNTGLINLDSDRRRRISVTIFLNNQSAELHSESYSGGSLVFSDWLTNARHEIAGERGMLLAFPSETTHEVTPVTNGERCAIVSWFGRREPDRGK